LAAGSSGGPEQGGQRAFWPMAAELLAAVGALAVRAAAGLGVAPGDPRSGAHRAAYDRAGPVRLAPDTQPPVLRWQEAPAAAGPEAPPAPAPAAQAPPPPPADPDFPPVCGAVPLPHSGLWAQYLLLALILAAAAWFYIRSVWPGVAQAGGFDHNAWEAAALLRGHVWTPAPPSGDTLDMMFFHGHWASFFPPLPAFILIPLVWYYKQPLRVPVREFCALIGALCPLLVYQMAERAGLKVTVRLWLTALFAFGTVFWYAVDQGTPWYYVQVCTEFFYLLALRESFGKNRPALVGSLFGAALLCRNTVALGVVFLFWRERRLDWRRLAGFCGPVALAVAVQVWWNWARTGNPLDTGYAHIMMGAGFRASFAQGMFSYKHIPWQIYSIFFMAPAFHGQGNFNGVWPYLTLSGDGQSLLLTTPAFLYALEGDMRRRRVWLCSAAVLLTAIPQLLYYANGTGQFGNRFSLDYTPLLMALLIFGIGRRFRWQHAALILASIFLSGYGAVYAAGVHLVPKAWTDPPAVVQTAAAGGAQGGCPDFPWLPKC